MTSVHDLAHAKGVPSAAREAMLMMQERIAELEAAFKLTLEGYAAAVEAREALAVEANAKDAVIAGLVDALEASVRAANLALFVIRKQGVMPNSSWQGGFERDMKVAETALAKAKESRDV